MVKEHRSVLTFLLFTSSNHYVINCFQLPIKIDIIKHRREIDGKSTSGHAAIIAPDDVKVYTYPDIPNYDRNNTVLIYPSSSAVEVHKLFDSNFEYCVDTKVGDFIQLPKGFNATTLMKRSSTDTKNVAIDIGNVKTLPVTKAVFIDSTWNQSNGIYKDERLKKLKCVVLQNRTSQFWRHQKGSPRWYLATVEAIHQFAVEMHLCVWGVRPEYEGLSRCFRQNVLECFNNLGIKNESKNAYFGQYDDLLFFFKHFYRLIHDYYDHDELYAYKRRLE